MPPMTALGTDATVVFQDSLPESGRWNLTPWKRPVVNECSVLIEQPLTLTIIGGPVLHLLRSFHCWRTEIVLAAQIPQSSLSTGAC